MRLLPAGLAVLALLSCVTSAHAQRFAIAGEAGYMDLTSSRQSAIAIFGSSGGATYGGSLRYVHKSAFYASAAALYWSEKGERVFLPSASGAVSHLGFPLSVRIVPITATVGYRFRNAHALVPYLGVGGGVTQYHEESDVTGDVETQSRSNGTFVLEGGLEYGKGPLRVAAEGRYSAVKDAVGLGGVSKVYGERDLGGWTVLGKLVYAFGR
jgi:opacity protein-like surface antigen